MVSCQTELVCVVPPAVATKCRLELPECFQGSLFLFGRRGPAESDEVKASDLVTGLIPSFLRDPLSERLSQFMNQRVVHQMQGLRRHHRIRARQAIGIHLRKVKRVQDRDSGESAFLPE